MIFTIITQEVLTGRTIIVAENEQKAREIVYKDIENEAFEPDTNLKIRHYIKAVKINAKN